MALKNESRALLLAACTALAFAWGGAHAQEVPVVTGQHWTTSPEQVKKAYLIGIANAVQVERAYAGNNPPSDAQSVFPRLTRGMRGQTLDGVLEALDAYYAKNPDKLGRPVIETIWFEIVVPGLNKP
jgi:hypothetical protein